MDIQPGQPSVHRLLSPPRWHGRLRLCWDRRGQVGEVDLGVCEGSARFRWFRGQRSAACRCTKKHMGLAEPHGHDWGASKQVTECSEQEMAWASDHAALTDNIVHLVGPARVGLHRLLALSAGHQALPHIPSDFKKVVVLRTHSSATSPLTTTQFPDYPAWVLSVLIR